MAPPSSNASRPGRMLAVLGALIVVLLLAIVGSDVASPGAWSSKFQVHLGLDLTSGTTAALKAVPVKGTPLTQARMDQAIQIMIARVNSTGVTEAQVEQQGTDVINVSAPGKNSQSIVGLVRRTAELQFRQVLLLAPNSATAATPAPTPSASASPTPSSSPSASASPAASASASASAHAAGLPGAAAPGAPREMARRARSLTGATASPSATPSPSASASASPTSSPAASATPAPTSPSGTSTWQQAQGDAALVSPAVRAQFNKLNCANKNWQQQVGYAPGAYNDTKIQTVSCARENGVLFKLALDRPKVVGDMVASASATPQNTSTDWQVQLNFHSNGTTAFGQLTTQMFDKYGSSGSPLDDLAVVLDGNTVSFPSIRQPITGGQAQITGGFTQSSATQLANQLSYGALPLSFQLESVQSVTPQLGHDQLDAGLIAAAFGLILVVFYLLLYYRGLALVAVSSLVIAALLAYLSVILLGTYQHFALSLAGIAGLIVAIGITADSFVVFFERLRDEVRDGRSLRAAVERGWARARRTILVSDTVSFLAAALLYYFAIGSVRGFAFTLGLTTVIDVLVVFTFTKPVITLLARTKFYGRGHRLSGLDPARLGARAPWRGSGGPARVPARTARTTPPKEA
ncbi:MAG TPA: protein translocase subunit SecD [Streptosporangiaceae bacterium]|nr:protein translocase subunit SecD [Streptosporangiaceae bacterium]